MHLSDSPEFRALLELFRRSPDTFWTAEAAATASGLTAEAAAEALSRMVQDGLVECARGTTAFRYAGESRP
jgi:hypothetical protein